MILTILDESNILGTLAEALAAHIDLVLSNDGTLVTAHAASAGTPGAQHLLGVRVDQSFSRHLVSKHYDIQRQNNRHTERKRKETLAILPKA